MKQDDMQQKTKTTVQSHDTALDWSIDQYGSVLRTQRNLDDFTTHYLPRKTRLVARAKSKTGPMVPGTLLSASGNIVAEVSGTCSFDM